MDVHNLFIHAFVVSLRQKKVSKKRENHQKLHLMAHQKRPAPKTFPADFDPQQLHSSNVTDPVTENTREVYRISRYAHTKWTVLKDSFAFRP